MIGYTLQITDDIQEYHTGRCLALSRRKTLNVLLTKLLFLAVDIVLILADLAHSLHIAVLSGIDGILEGF